VDDKEWREAICQLVEDTKGLLRLRADLGLSTLTLERPLPKPMTTESRLKDLEKRVRNCRKCELHQSRTQIVFGVGSPQSELVFVGEAPGGEEDRQGIPFVGRAGQLLTRIIEAMGMKREEVYICNVLKCRPPENRDPTLDEVVFCEPYLLKQLEILQPKVIVALGRFAVQSLLRSSTPISRLRGEWHDYHGIPLMPTFHPAYLLRNPSGKAKVWDDMKQVLAKMGRPIPKARK
jgi:DNA polymerase